MRGLLEIQLTRMSLPGLIERQKGRGICVFCLIFFVLVGGSGMRRGVQVPWYGECGGCRCFFSSLCVLNGRCGEGVSLSKVLANSNWNSRDALSMYFPLHKVL